MRRIVKPSHRYGEADFDRGYLTWGFHDRQTQRQEAESVLRLIPSDRPLRILDLACGIGTHVIEWARRGHQVMGVDLSETFIAEARKSASAAEVKACFAVGDIRRLTDCAGHDVVCWIENSFFDAQVAGAIRSYLAPGGHFVMDVRNPDHPKSRRLNSNWRTWREKDGVFILERHETDGSSGMREDVWIDIDPAKEEITEKRATWKPLSLRDQMQLLEAAGFSRLQLHTMEGQPFHGGEEPYWLWLVAQAAG